MSWLKAKAAQGPQTWSAGDSGEKRCMAPGCSGQDTEQSLGPRAALGAASAGDSSHLPSCFLQASTEFICKGFRSSSYSNAATEASIA